MGSPEIIGAVVGALGAIGTVTITFMKIKASFKKEIDEEIEQAITQARELADADIKAFNMRLDSISREISSLEGKVDKEIEHVKSIYNNEIRVLAEKIESLREEVRGQHSQLVSLLTKLVSDR